VWLVAASLARVSQNRKLAEENNKLEKRQAEIIKQREKGIKDVSMMLGKISTETHATHEFMSALMSEGMEPPPHATRVYCALLRNGPAVRLHMLPAKSHDEFIKASQAILGREWNADIIEYLDVLAVGKVVEKVPLKSEKKKMGLEQGLHFLELTRDKFAHGTQKKTMEAIINTYKKTYELA